MEHPTKLRNHVYVGWFGGIIDMGLAALFLSRKRASVAGCLFLLGAFMIAKATWEARAGRPVPAIAATVVLCALPLAWLGLGLLLHWRMW
jgi:hypothetical protein